MDGVDDSAEVGESYDNKTKRSDTSSSIDSSDSEIYPPLKNNRADQAAIASLPFADVTEGRAVLQARNYFLAAGSGPSGEGEDDAEEDGVFSESPPTR